MLSTNSKSIFPILFIFVCVHLACFAQKVKIFYNNVEFKTSLSDSSYLNFEPHKKKISKEGYAYLDHFCKLYKGSLLTSQNWVVKFYADTTDFDLTIKRVKKATKYLKSNKGIKLDNVRIVIPKVITISCDGYITNKRRKKSI